MTSKFELSSGIAQVPMSLNEFLGITSGCNEYDKIVVDGLGGLVFSLSRNDVITFSWTECDLQVRLYEFRGQALARKNHDLPDLGILSWSGKPIKSVTMHERNGENYIHLSSE